ncbi:hypothetical protein, partial [Providencia stuartii]|uniref:hypothetical protein n=1 Tax=Providencia stuartii TaxID=588 RepID=UPI0019536F00
ALLSSIALAMGSGRLHATYYGQAAQLRQLDCLVEHGAVFYRYLADMARQSVQLYQPQAILE